MPLTVRLISTSQADEPHPLQQSGHALTQPAYEQPVGIMVEERREGHR